MQASDEVRALLDRVEPVEWLYDGLGGSVIAWTHEHGSDHHDPSVLSWLLHRDGTAVASLHDRSQYQASSYASWLEEAIAAYEREHPRTRVPLVAAQVVQDDRGLRFPALEEARRDGRWVLLYLGREAEEDAERGARREARAARRFEKTVLDSETLAEAVTDMVLLRIDLAQPAAAAWAAGQGAGEDAVEAPRLWLYAPGAETPIDLGARSSGRSMAWHVEKAVEQATQPAPD